MKLKHQLLLLASLSLLFPITGWFALKSVDKEFRSSLEQASKNTLISLQASVQQMLLNDKKLELHGFVPSTLDDFILDGDDLEWDAVTAYVFKDKDQKLAIKIAVVDNSLLLLMTSDDTSKNINSPSANNNDHIIIALADDRGLYKYNIQRQAEGMIKDENAPKQPGFKAFWHEKANGYTLEMQFLNSDFHHLGLVGIDVNLDNQKQRKITGTLQNNDTRTLKLLPLVFQNSNLKEAIDNITPINNQFIIQDLQNRIIYQSDKLPSNQSVSAWQWIITPIYQWLFGINTDDMNNKWFYRQADGMAGIGQVMIEDGIKYQLKSMMPQGQQSMIQTLLKAGVMMIVVVLLLMLAYLGYSLLLAWRIKKLNEALQRVLDDSGALHIQMPSHKAGDEIGQLSRGIESMLLELREYTQYLKDLGSRLSHEMKTPLAIVQSSLDNLEMEQTPEFLKRAQDGTQRLRFILNQLSELSQLKYTLEQTPKELFDMSALIKQLAQSYQSLIVNLETDITDETLMINGSADLIAQMVDKLMDNAKDFIHDDGQIIMSLQQNMENAQLKIFNSDSQLPNNGLNIFDSLVSIRNKREENTTHLGLGLYLVQLIARYHKVTLTAENTSEPKGVVFTIEFKLSASI